MNIKKIVLDNIRCYDHFEFVPSPTGVTAISGDNGSGKSTIVDAFAWCLFGKKLNGLNTKTWIKEGKFPEKGDKVEVNSYITQGGKDYLVKREIINSNGTQIAWVYEWINNEWKELSGPSITHSEALVRQIVGVDEKGFLTATFVAQKEVDSIINTSPSQRGKIIEKLIGIESLSRSIEMSKKASKDLQKVIQVIQPGDIEQEKKEILNKKEEIDNLKISLKNNIQNLKNEDILLQNLSNQYNDENTKRNQSSDLNNQIQSIKSQLSIENEHLNSLIENVKNIDVKKVSTLSLEDLEKEITQFETDIDVLSKQQYLIENEISGIKNILSEEFSDNLLEDYKNIKNNVQALQEELQKNKEEELNLKSTIKSKKSSLKSLTGEEEVCPLCNQHIEDPQHLIDDYTLSINNFAELLKETSETIKKDEEKLERIKEDESILKSKVLRKETQEQVKKELPELKDKQNEISKKLIMLKAENSVLIKQYSLIKNNENNKNLLISLKKQIKDTQERLSKLITQEKKLTNEKDSIVLLDNDIFRDLKNNLKEKEISVENLKRESGVLNERYKYERKIAEELVKNFKKSQEAKEKYDKISTSLEIANASVRTLSRFKEERAKYSVPMLTVIASDILNRFTDGELVQVILSESFDVSVITKNNQERLVKQLSGGELSAVSIALRLAIALFLQEDKSGLLVLDEILVSMSEERATLILSTIQEISNSQIIFIAHNGSVNSVADKIIEL